MLLDKKVLNKFFRNAKSLAGKNALSVLSTIVVWMNQEGLHLKCTDLETWLFADIPFISTFRDRVLTFPKTLFSITALLEATKASGSGKNFDVMVIQDALHFNNIKIPVSDLEYEVYPDYKFERSEVTGIGNIHNWPAFVYAQKFVSHDDTRYFMNGIYFECDHNSIIAVATDGRTLFKTDPDFGTYKEISKSSEGFILKDMSKHFNLELKDFSVREKTVIFHDDIFTLDVRKIEGQFPNYNRVIPDRKNNIPWIFDKEIMKQLISEGTVALRMAGIRKDSNGYAFFTPDTAFVGNLEKWKERGALTDSIPVKSTIPDDKVICLNFEYLKLMMENMDTSEYSIHPETPSNKALMIIDTSMRSMSVVMPMRSDGD